MMRHPNVALNVPQLKMWPAIRAGGGLSMKKSIKRIFIFRPARLAHLKVLHRCVRAVIEQGFDNAKARAAMGAVGKGIKIAAVRRVKNLAETVGAGGNIRQYQSRLNS